ncbi:hypothetical protein Dimus_016951 [Dionaea muscipula]
MHAFQSSNKHSMNQVRFHKESKEVRIGHGPPPNYYKGQGRAPLSSIMFLHFGLHNDQVYVYPSCVVAGEKLRAGMAERKRPCSAFNSSQSIALHCLVKYESS